MYLLGLIHWQQCMRFGRLAKAQRGGAVPLKAAYLREVMGRRVYTQIIKAMEDSRAIACDHVAWINRRCYHFNLGPLFSKRFRECRLTRPRIIKAMHTAEKERTTALVGVHAWLKGNLERIVLDQRAFQAAEGVKRPDHAHTLLTAIKHGAWWYMRDKFGRCHTNLTNINRCLRKYLTVDGDYLISLDISCSQPIILALKMIGTNIRTCRRLYVPSSYSRIRVSGGVPAATRVRARHVPLQPHEQLPRHPHTLNDVTFSDMEHAAVTWFLKDAERGKLYDRFARHAGRTRAEVKPWVLRALYFDPKKWKSRRRLHDAYPVLGDIIDAFPRLYPGVLEYTLQARSRDHRKLPRDIQRDEAYVVYDMICSAIRLQRPETFVATIHDAILCKPADAEFVLKIMLRQFRTLGICPTINQQPA